MDAQWTIDQLAVLVAEALRTGAYAGQPSARVREIPDKRTIRYYTTLGLLDRPAEMRGRTAYYGRRHVLQLVALKRLQSQGLSLVEVQSVLLGADDGALARLADLPEGFWPGVAPRLGARSDMPASADGSSEGDRQADAQKDSVGTDVPASIPRGTPDGRKAEPAGGHVRESRRDFWRASPAVSKVPPESIEPLALPGSPQTATHLPLAEGVELVIEGLEGGRLDEGTLGQLAPDLERLLQTLARLGLLARKPNHRDNQE